MTSVRQILSAVFLFCLTLPALAESKLAFVVGIDKYPNLEAGAQLQRAVSDANSVGDALQSLGFRVSRVTDNATLKEILSKFDTFKESIEAGDTVLFYFAGHGISLPDGNYLIPADIPPLKATDERMAEHTAIAERDFTRDIRSAGARVAVIVIDACRNNPFPAQGRRALGDNERGLKRLELAEGAYSLYSAREGQSALDRLPGGQDTDPNSVFTRVFLRELKTPGINLSELGERVRDEVADLAREAGESQIPAVYNDMVGARSIFLNGKSPPPPLLAPAPIPASVVASSPIIPPEPNPSLLAAPMPKPAPEQKLVRLEVPPNDLSVRECDQLAASPFDTQRPAGIKGVKFDDIDANRAIPACQSAFSGHSDEPRFALNLGRAWDRSGNAVQAFQLYQKAADAGNADGMTNLGDMYEYGRGVTKDERQALEWYRKSVNAGNSGGMLAFGVAYMRGAGVAKDEAEALRWFRKAADTGDALGMNYVGQVYEQGVGVTKNEAEAARWYRKAAEAGDVGSMSTLGSRYVQGNGVIKDEAEAVRWYRRSAEAGNSDGMSTLGIMYARGRGVAKDEAEAMRWFRKAADAGDAAAEGWLRLLSK